MRQDLPLFAEREGRVDRRSHFSGLAAADW
jgi:hypothetical protein